MKLYLIGNNINCFFVNASVDMALSAHILPRSQQMRFCVVYS